MEKRLFEFLKKHSLEKEFRIVAGVYHKGFLGRVHVREWVKEILSNSNTDIPTEKRAEIIKEWEDLCTPSMAAIVVTGIITIAAFVVMGVLLYKIG